MKNFQKRMEGIEEQRKEQSSKQQVVYRLPKTMDSIEEWAERTKALTDAANKKANEPKGVIP